MNTLKIKANKTRVEGILHTKTFKRYEKLLPY
jgi:hypothetical protein